jgi:predicted Fe-Mo cluster-binding NifX family protein
MDRQQYTRHGDWDINPKPALDASGGAGVQASRLITQEGVGVVISGAFGPNAFNALDAASIKLYLAPPGENRTVSELIESYQNHWLSLAPTLSHGGRHGGRRLRV